MSFDRPTFGSVEANKSDPYGSCIGYCGDGRSLIIVHGGKAREKLAVRLVYGGGVVCSGQQ